MTDAESFAACERMLAENIADVASELRLINVGDLILFIRNERIAALEDLVNTASELYFRQGALRYGWAADLDLFWEAPPAVSLNMEFCWRGVTAFFLLRLDCDCGGVDLQQVVFDEERRRERATQRPDRLLARAIAEARLTPPHRPARLPLA